MLVATAAWWLGIGPVDRDAGGGRACREATAQQLLTEADLVVTTTRGGDGRAAAGVVMASDQTPGTRLLRGSRVALTVSSGRPTVPAIPAGTSRDDAEELIRAAGLDPDADRDDAEYSSPADEGTVLRTSPAPAPRWTAGATVRLVLSRGPERRSPTRTEQVRVPFVIGEDFDDARDELVRAGPGGRARSRGPGSASGSGTGSATGSATRCCSRATGPARWSTRAPRSPSTPC